MRARMVATAGALLALAAAGAPASAASPAPEGWRLGQFAGDAAIEERIVAFTNAARAQAGLRPLAHDDRLRAAARQHSNEMVALKYFAHASPVGSHAGVGDRAFIAGFAWLDVGENIYAAEGLDPSDRDRAARLAVDGWLNSPSHRANVLMPDFTAIGVGVAVKGRGFHATQVFGREAPTGR